MDSSQLEDSLQSDIFASPSNPNTTQQPPSRSRSQSHPQPPQSPSPSTPANHPPTRFDAEEARETSLQRELAGVRNINAVLENVIATLDRAKGNMGTVSQTVTNASTLLNTWTRILSQTEHNQRLILNRDWNGATADLAEVEAEAVARQAAAERRAAEEERRREEIRRRAEEEERRREVAASQPVGRGTGRGRGRGRGRGSVYSSGYGTSSGYGSADNTASSVGSSRGGSGIGRGFGASRAGRTRAPR